MGTLEHSTIGTGHRWSTGAATDRWMAHDSNIELDSDRRFRITPCGRDGRNSRARTVIRIRRSSRASVVVVLFIRRTTGGLRMGGITS